MDPIWVMLNLYQKALEESSEIQRFEEDEVAVVSLQVHAVLQKLRQLADTMRARPDAVRLWLQAEWQPVTGVDAEKMERLLFAPVKEEGDD